MNKLLSVLLCLGFALVSANVAEARGDHRHRQVVKVSHHAKHQVKHHQKHVKHQIKHKKHYHVVPQRPVYRPVCRPVYRPVYRPVCRPVYRPVCRPVYQRPVYRRPGVSFHISL